MVKLEHKQLSPKIYNLKGWINLVDEEELDNLFKRILQNAAFKILNCSSYKFPVNGYTAFWLLAESHLALHSFTDSGFTYIELSSCNFEKAKIFKKLSEELKYEVNWDHNILCCEPAFIKTE